MEPGTSGKSAGQGDECGQTPLSGHGRFARLDGPRLFPMHGQHINRRFPRPPEAGRVGVGPDLPSERGAVGVQYLPDEGPGSGVNGRAIAELEENAQHEGDIRCIRH